MISIYRKNITKNLTTIRANEKRDKILFRNGYLDSLLELLKSTGGGMHLGEDLKFVNESLEATLVQLRPSIISSHTLPPITHRVWKICSLWVGSRGTSLAWRALQITNSSPTSGVTTVWSFSSNSSSLVSSSRAWISSTSLIERVLWFGQFAWKCP